MMVVAVRVADAEDRPLPVGEAGEILVRGDSVMEGYWRDAEASARTLRGGWLHTGDVGSFDADGFLTLKDRSKDVIISGGSNIYPREVEEVLLLHPAVAEVSVVGMADATVDRAIDEGDALVQRDRRRLISQRLELVPGAAQRRSGHHRPRRDRCVPPAPGR